jgi:hypothetical protein
MHETREANQGAEGTLASLRIDDAKGDVKTFRRKIVAVFVALCRFRFRKTPLSFAEASGAGFQPARGEKKCRGRLEAYPT